jgi:hypothetical protein
MLGIYPQGGAMADSANRAGERRPRLGAAIATATATATAMTFALMGVAAADTPPASAAPKAAVDSSVKKNRKDKVIKKKP